MRRRLNLAGLLQYLLMIALAGLLVVLVFSGTSPQLFALALLLGALLAALPAVYIGFVLLPRQARRVERIRQDGLPAIAEALEDGERLAADFLRQAGAYKSLPLHVEVPVRVVTNTPAPAYAAQLLAPIAQAAQLKPGAWLEVSADPQEQSLVVPAVEPNLALHPWSLRPVEETDLPRLADLIRTAYAEQRPLLDPPAGAFGDTAESLHLRLESGGGLLAQVNGDTVGCIFYRPEAGYIFLSRLAVLPEHRRRGIGRALLTRAEQVAFDSGIRQVRLGVRAEITRNQEYYQRLGYVVIASGSHDGYTKITYFILEKSLVNP